MLLGLIVILMAAHWTEASLPPEDEENVLHIGGIFPIAGEGGWQGGQVGAIYFFFYLEIALVKIKMLRGTDCNVDWAWRDCPDMLYIFNATKF